MHTLQHIGLNTHHTTWPHKAVLMKIWRWPNPTSSLVMTLQSCALSSLAASWPLTAGLTSLQPIASECHLLPPTSLTLPCSGGSPLWSHTLNRRFREIGVSWLNN